jgi:hypothetical protein
LTDGVRGCGVMVPIMQQLRAYQEQAETKHNLIEEEIERFLISNYMIPCCEIKARMNGSFREF